jgi:hypothetical protein
MIRGLSILLNTTVGLSEGHDRVADRSEMTVAPVDAPTNCAGQQKMQSARAFRNFVA